MKKHSSCGEICLYSPTLTLGCPKEGLEFFQMDVKTTFLNGNLKDEIYMNKHIGLY